MATLHDTIAGFVAAREYDRATLHRLTWWDQQFGARELADITADEVDDAALVRLASRGRLLPRRGKDTEAAGKPLAGATIDRYVSQLATVYTYARRLRLLPRAHVPPTRGVELAGSPIDPERYLRPEEIERLLKVVRLLDRKWGRMTTLILTGYCTGLCRSNLLNLRWRDIDLKERTVGVVRTKNGRPIVSALSERAAEALTKLPDKHPEVLVFPGRGERPYNIRKLWTACCAEAGLGHRNFHQLRHALARAGVNQAQIMAIMGHRSLASSARYMHHNVDDKRRVVDAVFG